MQNQPIPQCPLIAQAQHDHQRAGYDFWYWYNYFMVYGYVYKSPNAFVMACLKEDPPPPDAEPGEKYWFVWYFTGINSLDILEKITPFRTRWCAWYRARDPDNPRFFKLDRTFKSIKHHGRT